MQPLHSMVERLKRHKVLVSVLFIFSGICSFVIYSSFSLCCIVSDSMAPTLVSNPSPWKSDWILVEEISPQFHSPARGKVVTFHGYDGEKHPIECVKRVAAVGLEQVEIRPGELFINGAKSQTISDDVQSRYENGGVFYRGCTLRIMPGTVMVLGDNSKVSHDSRYYGGISCCQIKGKALMRIWPPQRMGLL